MDTFWYGYYYDVNSRMFDQITISSLTNVDSGMAFSWKDRTIGPGATNTYSILIGVSTPPTLTLDGIFAPEGTLPDVFAGDTYTVSGTVSDSDDTPGTELYYFIDNMGPVKFYTFNEATGSFSGTVNIPEDLTPGQHTISIYAKDSDGFMSDVIQKNFTVLRDFTGHDLTYTSGQGWVFLF